MVQEEKITRIQELIYELKVSDVMKKEVIIVNPETLMSELREILRSNRISGTPVIIDEDKLVGIISIEDFIKWLAAEGHDCPVGEKMNKDVKTLFDDEPLIQAVSKFEQYGFGRFPVLDRESGKLVGVMTKGDIIEGLLKKLEVEYHEEEIHTYRASHIFEDIIADKTMLTFQYNLVGNDFKRAGECSSGLKKTLKRLGIHPEIVRRVAIATYEAEMNIIIYAQKGQIISEVSPDRIKIIAKDKGPGIPDIKKVMQPGYSTAPDWIREMGFGAGMGLNNIQKCADEMNLNSTVGKGTQLEINIAMKERK